MDLSNGPSKARFFWQGLLLFLPVLMLASAGWLLLRQDKRLAEQEARAQMQFLAETLANAVKAHVQQEFSLFQNANYEWLVENELVLEAGRGTLGSESQKRRAECLEHYPELDFFSLPLCQGIKVSTNGEIFLPREYSRVPSPPAWVAELSPQQRLNWHDLQQIAATATHAEPVRLAAQIFLADQPSPPAGLNAEYLELLIRSQALTDRQAIEALHQFTGQLSPIMAESGLPLAQLAYYQILKRCAQPATVPEKLPAQLYRSLEATPSILAPMLISEFERVANQGDAGWQVKARALRAAWKMKENTIEVLHALRLRHPPSTWANRMFWVEAPSGSFLAAALPSLVTRSTENAPSALADRPRSAVTNHHDSACTVRLYPREFIRRVLTDAVNSARITLPDYAAARIRVGDAWLDLSGKGSFLEALPKNQTVLGETVLAAGSFEFAEPMPLSVFLADPARLYAAQRQRILGFGFFIGVATLAALVGLFHARRVFLRQLEISEMRGNFVSSVSHELRAPIASVRLMAESLGRGLIRDEAKRAEYCRLIVQECGRLGALIGNVLDFARIDQGRKQYDFELTDLPALVQHSVRVLEPYAADKQVKLALETPPSAPAGSSYEIRLDGRAIQQALINLIDNAIKHSPAGAAIRIGYGLDSDHLVSGAPPARVGTSQSAAPHEPRAAKTTLGESKIGNPKSKIILWVSDQGPGIPPEEQERIFEPFYRRGSELRRETSGIGIGLSIVKHVVEAHDGEVRVESQPGQGSRFVIKIPLTEAF